MLFYYQFIYYIINMSASRVEGCQINKDTDKIIFSAENETFMFKSEDDKEEGITAWEICMILKNDSPNKFAYWTVNSTIPERFS